LAGATDRQVAPADQLAARVLVNACTARGTLRLPPPHRRLGVIENHLTTFGRCRTYGFVQHIANRLVTYERRHAPNEQWRLVDADPAAGLLCWSRPDEPSMPLVVDVLTSTGSDLPALDPASAVVTRVCDLADHRSSYIHFPGGTRTWPLCTADDPIRMGLSALFPNQEISA
jgi:hypothetical protein